MKVHHITREALKTEAGRDLIFGDAQLAAVIFSEGGYAEVCSIRDDLELDDAFRITQNIDKAWDPAGIHRSTMVGDIIEKDGVYHMVANFGFEKLDQLSA